MQTAKLPVCISEMKLANNSANSKKVFVSFYRDVKEITVVSLVQAYQNREDNLLNVVPGLLESIQRFDETVGTHDYMRYLFYARDTGFLNDCKLFWQKQLDDMQLPQAMNFKNSQEFNEWSASHEKEAMFVAVVRTDDSTKLISDCCVELAGALNCDSTSRCENIPETSITEMIVILIALSNGIKCYSDLAKAIDSVCIRLFPESSERLETLVRIHALKEMKTGVFLW